MKYGYKEIRVLGAMSLRGLCIEKNWYTCGTCKEYDNLLSMADRENITTDDIVEIATDIMEHSKIHPDYTFTDIMFDVAERCATYFTEA